MTNHCWHETEKNKDFHLNQSSERTRKIFCCNCGTPSDRTYKFENTQLEGHGKYYAPQTLVPQPVKCETECKDE